MQWIFSEDKVLVQDISGLVLPVACSNHNDMLKLFIENYVPITRDIYYNLFARGLSFYPSIKLLCLRDSQSLLDRDFIFLTVLCGSYPYPDFVRLFIQKFGNVILPLAKYAYEAERKTNFGCLYELFIAGFDMSRVSVEGITKCETLKKISRRIAARKIYYWWIPLCYKRSGLRLAYHSYQ